MDEVDGIPIEYEGPELERGENVWIAARVWVAG